MAAPIHYIYSHLHDAIRGELDRLGEAVAALQLAAAGGGGGEPATAPPALGPRLEALQEQYRFLAQVYTYHSSVEDEVRARWGGGGGRGRGGGSTRRVPPRPALTRPTLQRPLNTTGSVPRAGLQGAQRHDGIQRGA